MSGRAQDKLQQLQRSLTNEVRALQSQQSLIYGALQACDFNTQSALLQEYLERVDALMTTVIKLRALIGRHVGTGALTEGESEDHAARDGFLFARE